MPDVASPLTDEDLFPIVQMLDVHGRRMTDAEREVIGIATTLIRQDEWHSAIRDIQGDRQLKTTIDSLLKSQDESVQVKLLDEIRKLNTKRNGLTGESAVMLNCFLFAFNPEANVSIVSLNDRYLLMEYLDINSGDLESKSYGHQIIETRKHLLDFKDRLRPGITTWEFSKFLYTDELKSEWSGQRIGGRSWWIERAYPKAHTEPVIPGHSTEFGESLHSPLKGSDGRDSYRHMRKVRPSDVVLHLNLESNTFVGISVAEERFHRLDSAKGPRYYISLKDYQPLGEEGQIVWEDLKRAKRKELLESLGRRRKGEGPFYDKRLDLGQGRYLTPVTAELVGILDSYYESKTKRHLPYLGEAGVAPIEKEGPMPLPPVANYSLEDFVHETHLTAEIAKTWMGRLQRKKHIVFQGPPGTGKTYVAERLAKLLVSGTNGFMDIVQFHPAYTYEDFIQGLRPGKAVGSFELQSGRFLEFCEKARLRGNAPCVMMIDELNRGNPPRVFGELMYLLEHRDKSIPLAAGGNLYQIPENVFIIGTMNTADRSIALVDHAFRRRFSFIRLEPDLDVLRKYLTEKGLPAEGLIATLNRVNSAINDPNYSVGISYFMQEGDDLRQSIKDIWEGEIEPYLEEYFFDKPDKVDQYRWTYLSKQGLSEWSIPQTPSNE